jgi:hypothetical protein
MPARLVEAAARLWEAAGAQGMGDEDFTAIIKLVERAAGVTVGPAAVPQHEKRQMPHE